MWSNNLNQQVENIRSKLSEFGVFTSVIDIRKDICDNSTILCDFSFVVNHDILKIVSYNLGIAKNIPAIEFIRAILDNYGFLITESSEYYDFASRKINTQVRTRLIGTYNLTVDTENIIQLKSDFKKYTDENEFKWDIDNFGEQTPKIKISQVIFDKKIESKEDIRFSLLDFE